MTSADEGTGGRRPCALRFVALALLLAWAAAVRAVALPGPFGAGWQHLGAMHSTIARNFLRHGLAATGGVPVINAGEAAREEWVRYTHHPPGMGLSTAALFAAFGEEPWAMKLSGLLFSLLQVVVTWRLVARVLSERAGFAAAFATALLPGAAYYSTHGSDLGPQAISLALLALLLDERARERAAIEGNRPRSGAVLAAALAALFFDWPVLLVVAAIALRDLAGGNRARAALLAAFVPAAFLLHFGLVWLATGGAGGGRGGTLLESFLGHGVAGARSFLGGFEPGVVARRLMQHARFLFTEPGLAVALLGAVLALARRVPPASPRRAAGVVFALALLAAGYSLPFLRAVVIHQFWLIVALPLVALLIGAAVHATGSSRLALATWCLLGLAAGAWWSQRVIARHRADRTPFYSALGAVIRANVPAELPLWTTEHVSACTTYYAQRELNGGLTDAHLRDFLAARESGAGLAGFVAIVQPPFEPKDADCDELLAYLEAGWEPAHHSLPGTGATLLLFDLSTAGERR